MQQHLQRAVYRHMRTYFCSCDVNMNLISVHVPFDCMFNQVTGSCDNKVRIWRCPVGATSSANQMSSWTTELKESDFSPHTDWVRRDAAYAKLRVHFDAIISVLLLQLAKLQCMIVLFEDCYTSISSRCSFVCMVCKLIRLRLLYFGFYVVCSLGKRCSMGTNNWYAMQYDSIMQ
jgi:hypothetical protein